MFKKIIFIFNIIFFFINFNLFARDYLVIQSTTSTNNSGLVEIIETKYEEKYSIDLRFVSVGSGQAIINGKSLSSKIEDIKLRKPVLIRYEELDKDVSKLLKREMDLNQAGDA